MLCRSGSRLGMRHWVILSRAGMFLLDDSAIATAYTLPFLVGLAMPGWRSLFITGFAALAFAAFANAAVGGSLAGFLTLFFVLTAVGGLCCGLLTRAATLWIAPLSRYPFRFMAI